LEYLCIIHHKIGERLEKLGEKIIIFLSYLTVKKVYFIMVLNIRKKSPPFFYYVLGHLGAWTF